MSKWKCKLSGNIIDIPDWEDANMKGHDGYEKVEAEQEAAEAIKKASKKRSHSIDNETDSI